jgi:hypothetical protein
MRKVLLLSTALLGFAILPSKAEAGFVVTAVSALSGWWAALGATTYGALAQSLIQLGAGLAIQAATVKTPSTPDLKREFPIRTSLPAKRTVYGHTATTGTPAPWRVKGNRLYGCIIFNSRPSAGTNLSLTIDGRECAFAEPGTGTEWTDPADYADLFDFASDGQLIKIKEKFPDWDPNEEQALAWLGLGDQVAPPARILAEVPEFFQTSDAWKGRTVLWVSLSAGGSVSKRPKRWPNPEPVIELEMDWSLVWDPEDAGQDQDDPSTWTYSDNQARCLLDAARTNPVRAYDTDQLFLDTFVNAVPLADEEVTLWHASQDAGETVTEARYRVGGVIDWTKGELLDLLKPLADAGAGRLFVAGGRLGYIQGTHTPTAYTMTDILADAPVDFQRLQSRRDVPHAIKGVWTSAERHFEEAELEPYLVPGGSTRPDEIEDLSLPLVQSGTQAQRIVKIEALRRAAQKRLSCVLPPSAISLLPGATLSGALAAPFTRLNGTWQVESADPGVWLRDGENGKVAFRVPVELRQTSAEIYAWDPEADEREILTQELSGEDVDLGTVSNLTAQTVEVNSGGAVVLMVEVSFDPITDYVVDTYELGWREAGATAFTPLPDIPGDFVDDAGKVSARFGPVMFDQAYDLEVRAIGPTSAGLASYVLGIVAGLQVTGASAVAGPGQMSVDGTAPESGYCAGVRLYRAAVGETFADAVQVGQDRPVASGAAFSVLFGNPDPVDLVTGGDFADAGDWTTEAGWGVSSGAATHGLHGAGGAVSQALALSEGETYRISLEITALGGAGDAYVRLTGASDVDGTPFTGTGQVSEQLVAPASPSGVAVYADGSCTVTVDDLGVYLVTDDDLPAGPAEFWIVPYTTTGADGTPAALGTFTIT